MPSRPVDLVTHGLMWRAFLDHLRVPWMEDGSSHLTLPTLGVFMDIDPTEMTPDRRQFQRDFGAWTDAAGMGLWSFPGPLWRSVAHEPEGRGLRGWCAVRAARQFPGRPLRCRLDRGTLVLCGPGETYDALAAAIRKVGSL